MIASMLPWSVYAAGEGPISIRFAKLPGARVTAVCDIDLSAAAAGQAFAEKLQGSRPEVFQDMRKVLENKDIDAVSIATPNHWHALGTIWACQAGKDVYVEKPASHNIWEGQRMVEAARKYKRMVQVGMQAHSLEHYRSRHPHGARWHHRQGLHGQGAVLQTPAQSIGHLPDGPVPPGVDFDLWTRPGADASVQPESVSL